MALLRTDKFVIKNTYDNKINEISIFFWFTSKGKKKKLSEPYDNTKNKYHDCFLSLKCWIDRVKRVLFFFFKDFVVNHVGTASQH